MSPKSTDSGHSYPPYTLPTGLFSLSGRLSTTAAGGSLFRMFPRNPLILRATTVLAHSSCWVLQFVLLPLTISKCPLLTMWKGLVDAEVVLQYLETWPLQTVRVSSHIDTLMLNATSNDEDYRWVVLRAKLPTWLFQVVNLTFIGMSIQRSLNSTAILTSHLSCDPKPSPAPYGHSDADSRDAPDAPGSFRRRPRVHRAGTSRMGVHRGQPAIRLSRMEAQSYGPVRPTCTVARRTPRLDR